MKIIIFISFLISSLLSDVLPLSKKNIYSDRDDEFLRGTYLIVLSNSNLNKIKGLYDNNKNVSLKATELMAYGIDLSKSDEVIILDPTNNRVTLRFGDFYLQRIEMDSVRIFTKSKMNDEKRII